MNTRASRPPPGGPRQPTTAAHSFSSDKYPTRARRERTTAPRAPSPSPGADFSSPNAAASEATVADSSRLAHATTTGLAGDAHRSQRVAVSRESRATWPRASAALDANAAMFAGVAGSRNTPTGVSPRNSVICICRRSIRLRPNSYPSSSSSEPGRFLRSPFLRESPRPAYSMPGLYRRRRRLSDLTSTSPKSVTAPGGMSSKDCETASRTCRIRLVATERNSTTATRPFSASAKFAVLSMTGEDIAATAAGPPSAAMDESSLSERSWSATPPSDDSADRRGRTEAIRRAVSSSPRLAGAPAAGGRDDAGEFAGDAGGAPPPPPGDASSPGADPRSVATTNPRSTSRGGRRRRARRARRAAPRVTRRTGRRHLLTSTCPSPGSFPSPAGSSGSSAARCRRFWILGYFPTYMRQRGSDSMNS